MLVLQYVLCVVLLVAALFIVVAVTLQRSNEDGLSGAISGGSETYYGKDKSAHTDRTLYKWTLISAVVFVVAVLVVFIIQPDFSSSYTLSDWTNSYLNNYHHVFEGLEGHTH